MLCFLSSILTWHISISISSCISSSISCIVIITSSCCCYVEFVVIVIVNLPSPIIWIRLTLFNIITSSFQNFFTLYLHSTVPSAFFEKSRRYPLDSHSVKGHNNGEHIQHGVHINAHERHRPFIVSSSDVSNSDSGKVVIVILLIMIMVVVVVL